MPNPYRWVAFLVFAVAFTAAISSAQAPRSILDDPLSDAAIVAKQKAAARKLIGKRRNFAGEDQLRNELSSVPEVGLDHNSATEVRKSFVRIKKPATETPDELPPVDLGIQTLQKLAFERPEVAALPWQASKDRQLSMAAAMMLQNEATNLHIRLDQLPQKVVRDCNLEELREHVWGEKKSTWDKSDCLPAIIQILQVQPAPVRLLLVEQLAKIPGSAASEALAQRAIYDLSQQVRDQAVNALKSRPASEYQKVLFNGLRWPWRPVIENSAEALVRLPLENLHSQLEELLREPDPRLPYAKGDGEEQQWYVKEVVRMNHAQNCLLCHPASRHNGELVRGVVPVPGSKLPSRRFVYYSHFGGDLVQVRADSTTLRQDFSVMHQVGGTADNSPAQRFDYFVRERRATPAEARLHEARTAGPVPNNVNMQREAIKFVLHELGTLSKDLGTPSKDPGPAKPAVNLRAEIERLDSEYP
jgi:hypothetical protein